MEELKKNISRLTEQEAESWDNPQEKRDIHAVHIVFGRSAAGSLKMMLKHAKKDDQEDIIAFPGIFSIGPLCQLETKKGRMKRYEWLMSASTNMLMI